MSRARFSRSLDEMNARVCEHAASVHARCSTKGRRHIMTLHARADSFILRLLSVSAVGKSVAVQDFPPYFERGKKCVCKGGGDAEVIALRVLRRREPHCGLK